MSSKNCTGEVEIDRGKGVPLATSEQDRHSFKVQNEKKMPLLASQRRGRKKRRGRVSAKGNSNEGGKSGGLRGAGSQTAGKRKSHTRERRKGTA